tara:strand:+ start:4239 stop:4610 length:372 start_codon:yes stop_codon:yes gene_type:complete
MGDCKAVGTKVEYVKQHTALRRRKIKKPYDFKEIEAMIPKKHCPLCYKIEELEGEEAKVFKTVIELLTARRGSADNRDVQSAGIVQLCSECLKEHKQMHYIDRVTGSLDISDMPVSLQDAQKN